MILESPIVSTAAAIKGKKCLAIPTSYTTCMSTLIAILGWRKEQAYFCFTFPYNQVFFCIEYKNRHIQYKSLIICLFN